ncbi:hypothetical protein M514_03954 [Trichuris suis]|uniref:Chondroitin proteoglycan 4 domain-containing protein n=1 Tax=Trichuris suis TaxID=68888 RepID=A0A085N8U6_9BILA|nr:hypothetical protein M513_03954 [Trichuris suis]KFD65892.1 hypothetical protein M514_03954 [Trichuris suis]
MRVLFVLFLFVYIIREIDGSRILGLLSGKDAEEITVQYDLKRASITKNYPELIDEFEEIEQVCEAKCRKSLLCDCFFIKRLYDLCLAECKLEDAARLCEKQKELKRPTKNDTAVVERQPLCMK